jgi:hypothetical protein
MDCSAEHRGTTSHAWPPPWLRICVPPEPNGPDEAFDQAAAFALLDDTDARLEALLPPRQRTAPALLEATDRAAEALARHDPDGLKAACAGAVSVAEGLAPEAGPSRVRAT